MKFLTRLYLKLTGWTFRPNIPDVVHGKCVMICAPHTSNWDFIITLFMMTQLNVKASYAIKKEWMRFPFRPFLKAVGCIAINRLPRKEGEERESTVKAIARLFEKREKLCLMIAAEGTRSLRTEWKTGFYYIALEAGVPICLGYLDYAKKHGGIPKMIYPTGDIEADMREIMAFYADKIGRHPHQFSLDQRYQSSDNASSL